MLSVREKYNELGSDNYYRECAEHDSYVNRHKEQVDYLVCEFIKRHGMSKDSKCLDLACGNGEVTGILLRELGMNLNIQGVDPYLYKQYEKNTNRSCLDLDFKGVVKGELSDKICKPLDFIFCSFALHLCEQSMLGTVLFRLKEISSGLVILTPHKRPNCDNMAGWCLVDSIKHERVTLNYYI